MTPFRHVDHVELGWRLLGELSFDAAFARLEEKLMALATAAGAPQKYDRDMTRAYLEIIAARRRADESWTEFAARNRDLLDSGAALVRRVLASVAC